MIAQADDLARAACFRQQPKLEYAGAKSEVMKEDDGVVLLRAQPGQQAQFRREKKSRLALFPLR